VWRKPVIPFVLKRKLSSSDIVLFSGAVLFENWNILYGNEVTSKLFKELIIGNLAALITAGVLLYLLPRIARSCAVEVLEDGIKKNFFNGLSCFIGWKEVSSVSMTNGWFYKTIAIVGPDPKRIFVFSTMEHFEDLKRLLESKGYIKPSSQH
jgi:hypothetical protein